MSKKKFYSIAFGLCFIVGIISQLIQDRPFEFAASLGAASSLMLLSIMITFIIQLVNKLFKREFNREHFRSTFTVTAIIFAVLSLIGIASRVN